MQLRWAMTLGFAAALAACHDSSKAVVAQKPVADAQPDHLERQTPAHVNRNAAFRDPGVYLDGVPVGMLTFGELPVPLAVAWYEERAPKEFHPGDPGPHYKLVKQRRYRFTDYFTAIGIDLAKIKEVHIYGDKTRAAAVIITGDQLRAHPDFTFRFGADVAGKPLPACPEGVGDGKCPDSIGAVTVYIAKKPPIRDGNYFVLDGKRLDDIPYYGQALRGGVRVYFDGRMVSTIKRNLLQPSYMTTLPDGSQAYQLFGFLAAQKAAVGQVVEGWAIFDGRRIKKFTGEELSTMTFVATPGQSGEVLLGPDKLATHAIALHSKPVKPEDLPVIQPGEQQD